MFTINGTSRLLVMLKKVKNYEAEEEKKRLELEKLLLKSNKKMLDVEFGTIHEEDERAEGTIFEKFSFIPKRRFKND